MTAARARSLAGSMSRPGLWLPPRLQRHHQSVVEVAGATMSAPRIVGMAERLRMELAP